MKKILLGLLSLFLLLTLVGCGGGSSSTSSSTDDVENDLATITEDVKTKIKDGEKDVTTDVKDSLDTDSNLVGTWTATNAEVSDSQKGDYTLTLNEDTTYTEDISYVDADGKVTDASAPSESFKGVYLVMDNSIAILPEEGTVNGESLTGDKLYDPVDYGRTYDYEVNGDKLTLTNPETNTVIEFTKSA